MFYSLKFQDVTRAEQEPVRVFATGHFDLSHDTFRGLKKSHCYLNSLEVKILGATPQARLLVERSRQQLGQAKKRQAEELHEVSRRAQEEERLHKG